jgi:phosphatidylinositol 4-kinase
MGAKIVDHSLNSHLTPELKLLLVTACHRITKPRDIAFKLLDRLITGFPSLMCDSSLVFAMLDILTLLQSSCDERQLNEVDPRYLSSRNVGSWGCNSITPNTYSIRNEVASPFH